MNLTADDTSPNFSWSGEWRRQATNQVSINDNFFLKTYHAAQTKGAKVSITFVGSAFQIYGSTGPNHGKYSVTYDGTIKYTTGFAEQARYQQLLFSNIFGTEAERHTVVLQNEEDFWLDLDFMVLTLAATTETSTTDIGAFESTVTPATALPSSSAGSTLNGDNGATSSDSSVFKIITFALAGLLGVLLLGALIWFLRGRRQRSQSRNAGSEQEDLRYSMKGGPGTLTDGTEGNADKVLGIGRVNIGAKEDASYMQTPTTGSGYPVDQHHNEVRSVGSGSIVSGAARETLIALNNMGKRPGYKNLPGGSDGRETPTSLRTLGSAGQTWLGAASRRDSEVRFKGRARNESVTSDSDQASSGTHLVPNYNNRSQPMRSSALAHRPERDEEYADEGMGLDIYSSNMRNDAERRAADLRRSASVASSGILDRITSSPPPAVPELPPLSAQGSYMSSNNNSSRGMRSASPPPQTDNASIYSASDAYSALTLATRVRHPYGRGNSMLVSSNSSTHSGGTASTALRPPPIRTPNEDRERERSQRERERAEKEQEAARDRKNRSESRYSRPPPEYASPIAQKQHQEWGSSQGASLQRQGTRHGDIPITIEGGFGAEFESESQESHSHAYVGNTSHSNAAQHGYSSYSQPQHVRNNSAMGSGSTTLSAPKRTLQPEHNVRSYTPDRIMAVPGDRNQGLGRPSEDRVWTLDGVASSPKNMIGRPIIDDRTRIGTSSQVRRVSRVPAPIP
ncbi:SubName: Full=Uncharacterized protein {ECO:0000313/EMBL:CCA68253.1} [Serendipita indica DSM 11827]|uniref:Uncharacterized protein n=1 Tax=Serendipita indica (strain DSM 11827) TaxID=1109443 RepID=G4TAB0_SERID|nr:SubName: Full=Uncharacterized protein {ECO:0000313/EMBL:CCA68253.1} [Serendipita indica DSM 11827]CCA68253.1 hypothetical protein PIIN_02118 [Serendipita indica DSM 11827]